MNKTVTYQIGVDLLGQPLICVHYINQPIVRVD